MAVKNEPLNKTDYNTFVDQLFKYLRKSETVKNSILTTGAQIGSAGISAVALLWVSNQLGPEAFGIFSAIFSLVMLLVRILDLGINLAAQRYIAGLHNQLAISQVIKSVTVLKIGMVGLMAVAGWLLAGPISAYFNIGDVSLVRWSLILGSGILGYEWILAAIQGLNSFLQAAIMMFVPSIGKLAVVIILAMTKILTVSAVLMSYMLLPLLGVGYGLGVLKSTWISGGNFFSGKIIKTISEVSMWTSISIISAAVADNIDVLLVNRFLDAYATGLYSAASRISWLYSLVAVSAGLVLSVRAAKFTSKQQIDSYLRKVTYAGLIGLLGIIILIPTSPFILSFVGGEYLQATQALALLMIATGLTGFTVGYQALFYFFDKPQYYAWSGLLLMAILIVGDWVLIPRYAIWGAGMAKIISRLAVLVFTLWYTRKAYQELYGSR